MAKSSVSKAPNFVSVTNIPERADAKSGEKRREKADVVSLATATESEAVPAPAEAPASAPTPTDALTPGVTDLAISALRLDGGTQSRVSLNKAAIAEYAAALREGAKFPPVVAFYDGTSHWLADGFHRISAHLEAERTHVACEVRQGSQRDAILFSVSANASHGLRRTNADKRRAVEVLVLDPEWAQWSSREIAKAAGVDDKLVGKLRGKLCPTADKPQLGERKGADGKIRKAPTPKKARKAFNAERAAKAALSTLDALAKQWPAESRRKLVEVGFAWVASLESAEAKAAE